MLLHENHIEYVKSLISFQSIQDFEKKGWLKIDLGLDSALVKRVLHDLKKARADAIESGYPARRIYYDRLFDTNLASIELPYNDKICPESLREFFEAARIGSLVTYLMGWSATVNTLGRLFTMGNYNYRGQWHRDYNLDGEIVGESSRNRTRVQAGVYFDFQEGFRILKKEYDRNGSKSIFEMEGRGKIEAAVNGVPLPVKIESHMYDIIQADPGSLVLFDPYLYHQGSCNGSRLDLHLRFDNQAKVTGQIAKNDFQDFTVLKHLERSFDLSDLTGTNIPSNPRQSLKNRIVNSTNYFIPLYNMYLYIRNIESFRKIPPDFGPDIYSNTIFQRSR